MADSTARVTATSQTSLTSCTSGVTGATSFCTTDSSYDQYHDPPTISKEMEVIYFLKNSIEAAVGVINIISLAPSKAISFAAKMYIFYLS